MENDTYANTIDHAGDSNSRAKYKTKNNLLTKSMERINNYNKTSKDNNSSLVKQIKELQNIRTHKRGVAEKAINNKGKSNPRHTHDFGNNSGNVIAALTQHINEAKRNIRVSTNRQKRSKSRTNRIRPKQNVQDVNFKSLNGNENAILVDDNQQVLEGSESENFKVKSAIKQTSVFSKYLNLQEPKNTNHPRFTNTNNRISPQSLRSQMPSHSVMGANKKRRNKNGNSNIQSNYKLTDYRMSPYKDPPRPMGSNIRVGRGTQPESRILAQIHEKIKNNDQLINAHNEMHNEAADDYNPSEPQPIQKNSEPNLNI
jgi:hypothetical protein